MSRIGRAPITVPAGVSVSVDEGHIAVSGPKGSLDWDLPGEITVRQEGDTLLVERPNDERLTRSLHGLSRTLISNMVIGVSEGYRKNLEIVGVGYRAAAKTPDKLELSLGFSHPVEILAPEGISFEVPAPTQISVVGIDKQLVGQVAAEIRRLRKPEPYKGKGVRYAGERVARKAGKTGKR
jgi:large subunit ribosomal protein L6